MSSLVQNRFVVLDESNEDGVVRYLGTLVFESVVMLDAGDIASIRNDIERLLFDYLEENVQFNTDQDFSEYVVENAKEFKLEVDRTLRIASNSPNRRSVSISY